MAKWFNKLFNHKQGPTHNPDHPRYLEFHPELKPKPKPKPKRKPSPPSHQNCERKIQDLQSEIARVTQER